MLAANLSVSVCDSESAAPGVQPPELILLVHFNLSLPLQQRHSSQLDVDVIDAFVEKISRPLGNLVVNTKA